MSNDDVVIRFENVSKRYRLGAGKESLREALTRIPTRLLGLSRNGHGESDPDAHWALKNANFSVRRGEMVGLIGPNGAGKTTILKLLSRVAWPTEGNIHVRGRIASLIELGAGFHPDLTGRENIYLNASILGLTRAEIAEKFSQIVDFAELWQFIDTPVKRYSSGMYARLGFSVAAHVNPDIFLVDEVLAVGDTAFQQKCYDLLYRRKERGQTLIFVSHNLDVVSNLCDRVLWLNRGQVAVDAETQKSLKAYLDFLESKEVGQYQKEQKQHQNGLVDVEEVLFRYGNGKITTEFQYGDDIVVDIHYYARKKIIQPYFSLGVNDGRLGNLFLASMLVDGQTPPFIEGRGVMRCTFQAVPLMPKVYQLWGSIRSQGRVDDLVKWQRLAMFRVIEKDHNPLSIWQEASVFHIRQDAPIYVPNKWELVVTHKEATKTR